MVALRAVALHAGADLLGAEGTGPDPIGNRHAERLVAGAVKRDREPRRVGAGSAEQDVVHRIPDVLLTDPWPGRLDQHADRRFVGRRHLLDDRDLLVPADQAGLVEDLVLAVELGPWQRLLELADDGVRDVAFRHAIVALELCQANTAPVELELFQPFDN